ncbi:MAG: serine acetyltransferase [Chloroflexota bacterium]
MSIYERLVYARNNKVFGRFAYILLKLLGAEIPCSVNIGKGFLLHHGGVGVVIHPKTVVGERVGIYPGVTLGRSDVFLPASQSLFAGIDVGDDVILGAGSKVLCEKGILKIGNGTVLGANAVLLNSTGINEIWAGIPAKKVGDRTKTDQAADVAIGKK